MENLLIDIKNNDYIENILKNKDINIVETEKDTKTSIKPMNNSKRVDITSFKTGYMNFLNENTFFCNISSQMNDQNEPERKRLPLRTDCNVLLVNGKDQRLIIKKNVTRIAHNMCVFRNKENTNWLGIGGRYMRDLWTKNTLNRVGEEEWKKYGLKHYKGLYLLSTINDKIEDWDVINNEEPVISEDTVSKFKHSDSYDSQISCLYSTVLNKYVLITRNNIKAGKRFFTVFHSDDCITWEKPIIPEVYPELKPLDQYYSVIIHELKEYKLFVAVGLFMSGKGSKQKNTFAFRLLLSRDTIHWTDCGSMGKIPPKNTPGGNIRHKIHCGGITSDESTLTFYLYDYIRMKNMIYYKKTIDIVDLFKIVSEEKLKLKYELFIKTNKLQIVSKRISKSNKLSGSIEIKKKYINLRQIKI